MLACNECVTLVKCNGETYSTYVFDGVSWYDKTKVQLQDKGLVHANIVKIRIPADLLADGIPVPEAGDHVFLGRLADGEVLEKPADLAQHHPRKVMSVSNNLRGGLPHIGVMAE